MALDRRGGGFVFLAGLTNDRYATMGLAVEGRRRGGSLITAGRGADDGLIGLRLAGVVGRSGAEA